MKQSFGRLGSFALLAVLVPPAFAAEIKGAVTDAAGGALGGARVSLENVATGALTSMTTDAGGRYSFGSLTVGIYRVSASVLGFSEEARTLSLASDGESLETNLVLSVGNLSSTVTVTAARGARDVIDVPLRAESLGEAQLQQDNPTSTGEAMIALPGITPVANGPFQVRPRLRGLDSTRVLILVDGERLNNARTATDRAGIEVGLVDAATIESIEAVSGAGSVLYGTDALAGTINIITTQPRFTDATRFTGGLSGYFSANENGARGTATVGVSSKRYAFRVSGTLESFDNYESGGEDGSVLEDTRPYYTGPCTLGGTTINPCLKQADTIDDNFPPFNFNAFPEPFNAPYVRTSTEIPRSSFDGSNMNALGFFSLTEKQTVQLKYIRRHADDIGFPDFIPPQFFQGIVLPFSNLDKVSARYQFKGITPTLSALTATFYWQHQDRKLQNIDIPIQFPVPSARFFPINVFRLLINSSTEQDVKTWGFDLQNTFLLTPKNVLTAGFTVYRDRSEDDRVSTTQMYQVGCVALSTSCSASAIPTGGPRANVFPSLVAIGLPSTTFPVRVPDASFRDIGIFVQDEWDLTPKVKLVAGLRFDAYNVTTDMTPGYEVASLTTGAQPPIDPDTLPDLNGDSVSREALTGNIGLIFKATERVSFMAHYGRSYRHPNLEELLFSGPATIGNIVPNITVDAEKGNNFDLGVKVRTGRFQGSLNYFYNRYDGFISTEIVARGCCNQPVTSASGSVSQAVNFADVQIYGLEGDINLPLSAGGALFTVFANAAYNQGTILSGSNPLTGTDLSDTPQDNITPFKMIGGLRISDKKSRFWVEYLFRHQAEVEDVAEGLVDSPFLIAQDVYGLAGFTVHRVAAGIDWQRPSYSFGLSLALENLANEYYREQFQFAPARGRSFTVGIHIRKL